MKKRQKGERNDGYWLRDLPVLNQFMPCLMPNRADNEAYINMDVDLRPLDEYLAKKNAGRTEDKFTYFHLITAAVGKVFVLRPRMNRFIVNYKIYQRKNVSVAFIVKKKFNDKAEESMAVLNYDPHTTLDSFHEELMKAIHDNRRDDVQDTSSATMSFFNKLPHWIIRLSVKVVLWLDKYGKAPKSVIASDPNHAAVFLSNLGSINLECGYHHLVNWGTNSCFVVIGKKHWTKTYSGDGTEDLHEVIPLGITLDERIADGYYYSGSMALLRELLAHPELLEAPADTPVEFSIRGKKDGAAS